MNQTNIRGQHLNLSVCSMCCHVMQSETVNCLYCGLSIKQRFPYSLLMTGLFTLAALICYIPANILPMFIFHSIFSETSNTIIEGIKILLDNKLYGIACIVFSASIVIPIFKIISMLWLIIAVKWSSARYIKHHMRLYRFIERIGRWSMLDIFVISVMLTLLNVSPLISITIDWGTSAFGLVVLFTMLATLSFDTRLLWDAVDQKNDMNPE
ncbi:MAG: paraquat-inducible membrane protein A [Endozoicomonadaceae bacterium]|nr:paraquat-inducible membrane protein A [Endozoicomonadaceae bacterium]